jgi:hypothetical protein
VQITITSSGIQAAVAVLGLLGAAFLWVIRMIVQSENSKQLKLINGTYTRSGGSSITGSEIERRINDLEDTVSLPPRITGGAS